MMDRNLQKGELCMIMKFIRYIYIILYYSINMHVDISTEEEREREIEILMVGQLGISSSGPILSWKS